MTKDETVNLYDKTAAASFVLSVIGLFVVPALPVHISALWLGISSVKSKKHRGFMRYGIILSAIGFIASVFIYVNLFINFDKFLASDFFAILSYYFFTIN